MTNYEIRAKAREQLGNNIFGSIWLYALVATLIATAILGVASITVFGTLLLTGPLYFGVSKVFLGLARGRKSIQLEDTLSGFNDFVENLLLGLITSLFVFLWSLLLVIPGIVKAYSYSMVYFIKNDNPTFTWQQCIDESRRIMNGNKARLFLLDLSFLGWIILGSLCFGIGLLWVNPYMETAHANFYEEIRQR